MRSVLPMKVAKWGSVAVSLFLCVLGVLVIINPELFISSLGNLAGVALIVFGIIKIVGYLSRDLYRLAFQYDLAFGLLMIAVGILVLIEPDTLVHTVCIAIGISALMDGLLKVQISIDSKAFGIRQWWLILAVAVITSIIGLLLIFRASESARIIMIILGISLIADGILNLITMLLAVKIIKHQYPDVIEADYEDIY